MSTVKPILPRDTSRRFAETSDEAIAAAEAYEEIFVPALFQHWPAHVISAAGVESGHRSLDIACGTGVLTRQLRQTTGGVPAPIGLDIAPGMLEVAQRLNPSIEWRQGDAVSLPFADAVFDRVLCQYGLMFFSDRVSALREMRRVLAPGGRVAVAVWDSLDENPGFLAKVDILDRVAGRDAGDALRAPFCLGDRANLLQLARQAGWRAPEVITLKGEARFRNIHEFVEAEVRGWLPVMDVHLPEDVIEAVHEQCARLMGEYGSDGRLVLPVSTHIITGNR